MIFAQSHKLYRTVKKAGWLAVAVFIFGCNQTDTGSIEPVGEFKTIEWIQLIPEAELTALLNPPDFLESILDGSSEDQIDSQLQTTLDKEPKTEYEKALVSSNVVSEFNSQNIRLPGFIVPLEFSEDLVLNEFFLVPYFGACLHTPPPPPNQIVYVKHAEGFKLDSLEQPYWVSGLLTTDSEVNDMAHAAYSLTAQDISPYEEVN